MTNNIVLSETFKARSDERSNFDESFSLFNSELYKLYDTSCPIRTEVISINMLSQPWLTPDIMILKYRKS